MRLSSIGLALLVYGTAHAQSPESDWAVDMKASTITYHVVHKLHHVSATSHQVDGTARLLGNDKAQVIVRAAVGSFDSGNVNRDAHMKEAVEAARFPTVEVKALADGMPIPKTFPTTVDKTFKSQVLFHGIQRVMDIVVKLIFENATRIRVTSNFAVSLDEFKVERPSLMFVKVADALGIDANLVFVRQP
jgi:hypothetical protein